MPKWSWLEMVNQYDTHDTLELHKIEGNVWFIFIKRVFTSIIIMWIKSKHVLVYNVLHNVCEFIRQTPKFQKLESVTYDQRPFFHSRFSFLANLIISNTLKQCNFTLVINLKAIETRTRKLCPKIMPKNHTKRTSTKNKNKNKNDECYLQSPNVNHVINRLDIIRILSGFSENL